MVDSLPSSYLSLAGRWIHPEECDSLLFSCLYAVGANQQFALDDAYFNGLWHRRPEKYGACSSTISRDMFMGLFVYCLHFKRIDLLDQLWLDMKRLRGRMGNETKTYPIHLSPTWPFWTRTVESASSHVGKWTFQIPDNRTWFTPGMIALLAQLRAALKGSVRKTWWNFLPQIYSTDPGYTSHLTMLHLYLNLRLFGGLSWREKRVLTSISVHSPKNALLLALLGNRAECQAALANWPPERVPTSEDWAEEWRTQRQDNDVGLLPAKGPARSHSGGDYLFVRHVLDLTTSD